jgi:hypothetical protein
MVRKATESVQVCVEFNGLSLADVYFEDMKTQERFNVISIDDVVSVNIGLYNGEGWYRWVWIWESTQEADEAWSKAPANIEETIEELVQRINNFIGNATRNVKSGKSRAVLDMTPELRNIGWEITLLDYTPDQVIQEYRLRKKVQGKRKK